MQYALHLLPPTGMRQAAQAVPQAGDAFEAGHLQVQRALQLTRQAACLVADTLIDTLLLYGLDLTPKQNAGAAQHQ